MNIQNMPKIYGLFATDTMGPMNSTIRQWDNGLYTPALGNTLEYRVPEKPDTNTLAYRPDGGKFILMYRLQTMEMARYDELRIYLEIRAAARENGIYVIEVPALPVPIEHAANVHIHTANIKYLYAIRDSFINEYSIIPYDAAHKTISNIGSAQFLIGLYEQEFLK